MKKFRKHIILFFSLSISIALHSQNTAVIYGKVTDNKNTFLELVSVSLMGQTQHTVTDKQGNYELQIPANTNVQVFFTFVGLATDTLNIVLKPGDRKEFNRILSPTTTVLPNLNVNENKNVSSSFTKINPRNADVIPSGIGGVEALIKTLPGVSSNNELSSQYNVRGGNFDENLVYVNGIEVYRPFLIYSGQQEGLSFINPDLVSDIQFSAGGFDAKYGDKMSSVLDIQYKKPSAFAASASGSLLGYTAHVEGISKNTRLTYLFGFREKSNKYLLSSLDTKGDYQPKFTDVQGDINYVVNDKFNIDFLGNYSHNVYKFIPQTRQTDFGSLNDAMRLTIYFDGQEVDQFDTYFGAFSGNYNPKKNINMKFIVSAFDTKESETFDTQGEYWLDQLESNMGNTGFGNVAYNLGVGAFLNHARDYLNATVLNVEHKGIIVNKKLVQYWGVGAQREYVDEQLSEWQMSDSAGYSQPYGHDSVGYTNPAVQPNNPLLMQNVVKANNSLTADRYTAYYQQKWIFDKDSSAFSLTDGVRANYDDLNHQLLVSPRATLSFKPDWKRAYIFRFSTGYYSQPPFFKELIDLNGNMNENLKAQTSIHFVLSSIHDFKAWNRPFTFTTEAYYKILNNIIPYEVDDVRIRYFANNNANGYATGVDMKVNGEFVRGLESWISLSIMNTKEKIKGDYYYTYLNKEGEQIITGYTADQTRVDSVKHQPGYIPCPTNQLVNFAMFFQDYLPRNPTYKMHLSFIFGSGLPFGPPGHFLYKDTLRYPPYKRVDIGFSKELKTEHSKLKPKNPFRYFKTIWLSLEVFNLLQANNTISYIWISDVNGRQYAVPNYLTPRQINLKLVLQF